MSKERKRGKRGEGRLYLRNSSGKEYKAGTKGVQGAYWLEYWRPTGKKDPETGKPIKQRQRNKLTYREDDGKRGICKGDPITTLADAKEEQIHIIEQYVTGSTNDRLQKIKAELDAVEHEHDQAIENAIPPLSIADAWDAYDNSPKALIAEPIFCDGTVATGTHSPSGSTRGTPPLSMCATSLQKWRQAMPATSSERK